jgi:predicted phosphoribosyltransferase
MQRFPDGELYVPTKLVVAIPVGSHRVCTTLRPDLFEAVGSYYTAFSPAEDAEIQQVL